MKPKEFLETFPIGYVRERNQNGSVALTLNTEGAAAYLFVKKVAENKRMPPLCQEEIDVLQSDMDPEHLIIDWYNDETCRYILIMDRKDETTSYHVILNAFFGSEAFDLRGYYFERGNKGVRETIYKERYLKSVSDDAITTNTDFANESYDILFPDHPLSHCRRLANVITLAASFHPSNMQNVANP